MKTLLNILTLLVFLGLNFCHNVTASEPQQLELSAENQTVFLDVPDALDVLAAEKTTYFVKIGNTISKLEDKEGYIIAAKRLGMESILIIPDGKVYRTVSLDLHKDDETLKNAIEVKLDEIIIAD